MDSVWIDRKGWLTAAGSQPGVSFLCQVQVALIYGGTLTNSYAA